MRDQIQQEAARIEEDSLYSSKGHFYAGQRWSNLHLWIGIPAAVLAAVAGASALSEFQSHTVVAGILSIIVVALTAVATFVNPNERAISHKNAGNKYNSLRNRSRIFYSIELPSDNDTKTLAEQLKSLDEQRSKLNEESPQIPKWAFEKARKGIADGEASYKVDDHGNK
jgi:hypothetical protein